MEMRSGLEPEGHGVAIRYNSRSANASYESGRRPEEKGDEQVERSGEFANNPGQAARKASGETG
jgi:hypothetical protein